MGEQGDAIELLSKQVDETQRGFGIAAI